MDTDGTLDEGPDRTFRFLSRAQGVRLRELCRAVAAHYGEETTVGSDHLRAGARIYTLHSLAVRCREARDEDTWPEIVDEYFRVAVGVKEPDRAMDPTEVLAHSYLQILPPDFGPGLAEQRSVRRLAEGLLEVPVLDRPNSIHALPDEDAERIGLEALRTAGRANLLAVPIEHHQLVPGRSGEEFHLVAGESFFTASKVLMLPDLVRQAVGEEIPPYGALVSVPHRQMVAFHLIRDKSYFDAAHTLLDFGMGQYETAAGRISPAVYWWRAGPLHQVLRIDGTSMYMEQMLIELPEYLKYDKRSQGR